MAATTHPSSDLYGGIALGVAAIAALMVANSPLGPSYDALLQATGEIRIGSIGLAKSLEHWINDGLMATFFLLLALAIIDDLMAIVVIAIFHTAELSELSLTLAGLGVIGLFVLNRLDVRTP